MQSLTNGGLSRNGKAILFRVDYIVISALYKGAIIQKIHKILWLLSAFENFLIKFCS